MKFFAPGVKRVEKDIVARVKRRLQGKGDLKVSVGQEVTPEEILGASTVSAGFRIINLSTLLSVSPGDAEKYLTAKLGQRIYQGELLARKPGWLLSGKKIITSPTDGILDFLNSKTGELKISFLPKKVNLPAGVYGIVEAVDSQRGQVIIRTQISMLYGAFGSGRPRDGILHVIGKKDELISKAAVDLKYKGNILAGGSLFFKDAITASISAGVNGIITGGLNEVDYKSMAGGRLCFPRMALYDIGISVVASEGSGSVSMGGDFFELLSEYEGKFVFIDGNKAILSLPSSSSSCMVKVRSTKLPPLKDNLISEKEAGSIYELKIGCKVRVVGSSYLGEQGKVTAVNETTTLLPSGVKTNLVTIETLRRKIQVPVANLEILM